MKINYQNVYVGLKYNITLLSNKMTLSFSKKKKQKLC